eukprot:11663662-Prorocentrum_lima.AAC.1
MRRGARPLDEKTSCGRDDLAAPAAGAAEAEPAAPAGGAAGAAMSSSSVGTFISSSPPCKSGLVADVRCLLHLD